MGLYDKLPHKKIFTLLDSMLVTKRVKSIDADNFKVSLYITSEEIDFSDTKEDGSNIKFTNEVESTNIHFKVESWDKKNHLGLISLTMPKSIKSKNTKIKMFWGGI